MCQATFATRIIFHLHASDTWLSCTACSVLALSCHDFSWSSSLPQRMSPAFLSRYSAQVLDGLESTLAGRAALYAYLDSQLDPASLATVETAMDTLFNAINSTSALLQVCGLST